MADDLAQSIRASAERLGISPSDLGTAISYETGATFDPWKKGPTTQWGEHRGLIQWGEPQRKKYGVTADMPVADQMKAVEAYLTDAGVKPGHGLLDVYSAINSGRVGRYGASDAHNGGAPGTVADKVAGMAAHRARANALLGIQGGDVPAVAAQPAAVASNSPMSLSPGGVPVAGEVPGAAGGIEQLLAGMAAIPKTAAEDHPVQAQPMMLPRMQALDALRLPTIHYPVPANRARAMARAAARAT